jgi:general secretion pathway protein G
MKPLVRFKSLSLVLVVALAIVAPYFIRRANVCAWSRTRAREATLRPDLFMIRQAIENYTLDKHQAPKSMQDLVDAHYLPKIPIDPCTGKQDWVLPLEDPVLNPDLRTAGFVDVHSNSHDLDRDGTTYSTW